MRKLMTMLPLFILHISTVLTTSFPFPADLFFVYFLNKITFGFDFPPSPPQKNHLLEQRMWILSHMLGRPSQKKMCLSARFSRLQLWHFSGPSIPWLLLYVSNPGNDVTVQLNFNSVFTLPLEREGERTGD